MKIAEILDPRRVVLDLTGSTKSEVLGTLARIVVSTHPDIEFDTLLDVVIAREEASSTAIADGIAIPHGKVTLGEEVVAAFGLSRNGIDFDSVDGRSTHLFFLLVSPESHPSLHLRWLAHLAILLKNPDLRNALSRAESTDDVFEALDKEERALAELQ